MATDPSAIQHPTPSELSHQLPAPFNTSPEPLDLIAQGAESLLFRTTFLTPTTPAALKVRPKKAWRHPILDKRLTRARILAEARVLVKLSGEGIAAAGGGGKPGKREKVKGPKAEDGGLRGSVPRVLGLDWEAGWMATEWVEGVTVKRAVQERVKGEVGREEGLQGLLRGMGSVVGRLHAAGVVHGDLTTSNMMVRPRSVATDDKGGAGVVQDGLGGDLVLIDFGLSTQSTSDEDRAVDLYVLERAFGSTHPREEDMFPLVIEAYGATMNELGGSLKGAKLGAGDVVLKRLEDVRMRGRKKSMIG